MSNEMITVPAVYEEVRDCLFFSLHNRESVKEFLEDYPHWGIGDLVVFSHIDLLKAYGDDSHFVSSGDYKKAVCTPVVNNQLLDLYGITEKQLLNDTLKSAPVVMPPRVQRVDVMLSDFEKKYPGLYEGTHQNHDFANESPATIITNATAYYGAAVMLYPEVLKELAGSNNLFLIPSSVHEFICIVDDGMTSTKYLENLLRWVNSSEVAASDFLSDTLYYYDSSKMILRPADCACAS